MVPSGVVVFLPSYDYEQTVVKRLMVTGQLAKIEMKKKIFRLSSYSDSPIIVYLIGVCY